MHVPGLLLPWNCDLKETVAVIERIMVKVLGQGLLYHVSNYEELKIRRCREISLVDDQFN